MPAAIEDARRSFQLMNGIVRRIDGNMSGGEEVHIAEGMTEDGNGCESKSFERNHYAWSV